MNNRRPTMRQKAAMIRLAGEPRCEGLVPQATADGLVTRGYAHAITTHGRVRLTADGIRYARTGELRA